MRRQAHSERTTPGPARTPQYYQPTPAPAQFAHTPRFGFGKPSSATQSRQHSPPRASRAKVLRAALQPGEGIDETAEHDDQDDEMLDNEQAEALPTTELSHQPAVDQTWTSNLPHSPKRRRLDDHGVGDGFEIGAASPARPTFKHPTTPASALAARSQKFTRAGSVASSVGDDKTAIRRPAFLRSSLPPPERTEPLPEAFSPHRRGEKFVPGGMAATMQQWVIETGQSAFYSRKGQGYLRGEDYVLRVKVASVQGHTPLLVEATQTDGTVSKFLLIVDTKKESFDPEEGSILGIRAPTWEVELAGQKWTIGVDWKVLQQ